jgi:ribonuclease HI
MKILIQTDGAADWHDRIGGWAYIIWMIHDSDKTMLASKKEPKDDTTNVQMELTAIKRALRMFEFLFGIAGKQRAILETDSEWTVNCLNGKSDCTMNTSLLNDIRALLARLKVEIKWVPRDQLKDVDTMAKEAMRDGKKKHAR